MKNPNSHGLPWSNNEDTDILEPCILCRTERAKVCDKYCIECYRREKLINLILQG